jgi:hypothetical protein
MSQMGQKAVRLQSEHMLSGLPSITDMSGPRRHFREVPKAAVSRCSKNPQSNARRGQLEGLDLIIPCWD